MDLILYGRPELDSLGGQFTYRGRDRMSAILQTTFKAHFFLS